MSATTGSDHQLVLANIQMEHLIKNHNKASSKRKKAFRWVFLYEDATKDDWQNYVEELNGFLKRKLESEGKSKSCFDNLSLNEL